MYICKPLCSCRLMQALCDLRKKQHRFLLGHPESAGLLGHVLGSPLHHISYTRPLIWRFRCIIYLEHAPHLAIPIPTHHISSTCPIWRCLFSIYLQQVGDRFNMYLERAPSFGVSGSACIFKHASSFRDSGSSYILNMPPHFAIPIRPRSTKRPLFWRFRFIMYLKPSPLSRFRFIIYLQHGPSFGESNLVNTPLIWRWRFRFITYLQHAPRPPSGGSGSSYLQHGPSFADSVNMPLHLAIPHHHTSYTRPLVWRF